MFEFVSSRRIRRAVFLAAAAMLTLSPAIAQNEPAKDAIPDFMAPGTGWTMINSNATDYVDPASGPKPVTNDPHYPHVGNLQPGQKTERVADLTNPILQDWVKPQMQKYNQEVIDGTIPFVATSLCWPGGVPAQLLVPTTMYFIQKPDEVIMIWERDQLVRHVYLNQQHAKNPRPTWFGDSIGHYENGDTLVIDTIGFAEHPMSFVDNYRTPHTKQLHVTERWKITNVPAGGRRGGGGTTKGIEVTFTVEDPGAFTMPWGGMMRYRNEKGSMEEFVCAENNGNHFAAEKYAMPQAKTPDF
ncbi:MAG TPA: hypothetical protein VNH44_11910 [Micropepsaceae bacterium]|nr:hypothetical protein [Micropepsaceae bacterium]